MKQTIHAYDQALEQCRELFLKKTADYGVSWRILRPTSLTDQLYIKAARIRTIEEKGEQQVEDPIIAEYRGIVNYSVMALIQLDRGIAEAPDLSHEEVQQLYEKEAETTRELMIRKNHDYGEAWRKMRLSSITDMILTKLLRIKQIENNAGQTLVSEGIDAGYRDIMNYALFALIRMAE